MSLKPKNIQFESIFPKFCDELSNMYSFNNVHVSGIDMFQMVYDMCNAIPMNHREALFDGLSKFLNNHTSSQLQNILQHDDIVTAYATEWEKYLTASQFTDIICEYLNKMFMGVRSSSTKKKKPSVKFLAYSIWREQVLYKIKNYHSNRLIRQIMLLIKDDRDGNAVPYEAIRKAINSFVYLDQDNAFPMGLYLDEFESIYLAETKDYYVQESNKFIASHNIFSYMQQASQRLHEELTRSQRFCNQISYDKVTKVCEQQYIAAHQQRIHAQFVYMIEHELIADCKLAYSLLSRIPGGVDSLLQIYEGYIVSVGKDLIVKISATAVNEPREYVESLVASHSKYVNFATDVFKSDALFIASVDKAFRHIINDTTANAHARAPEILARYCDAILRKTTKANLIDNELENRIVWVMTLFKYVDDKDVFQKHYSKLLARRLIFETSVSDDAEASVISKLKAICGVEYTTKLQRMFTDMSVSHDLNKSFKSFVEMNRLAVTADCNVMVLTAGSWLISTSQPNTALPQGLEKLVTTFTNFYNHHHSGRKLTWLNHLARAEVKLGGFDKRYELSVSLAQVSILMMMNDGRKPSWKDMKEALKLNDTELLKHAKPLMDIKLVISSTDVIKDGSIISIGNFVSKRTKIKLSGLLQIETQQENDTTKRSIEEDRAIYLQATIVRIMKSRKHLVHQSLMQEVLAQVSPRFNPSVGAIKKAIEQLLDKGYIERSTNEKDFYDYVA